MTQNSNLFCLEFNFASNSEPSQNFRAQKKWATSKIKHVIDKSKRKWMVLILSHLKIRCKCLRVPSQTPPRIIISLSFTPIHYESSIFCDLIISSTIFCDFTMSQLSFSWIHYESTIVLAISLWIYNFFCDFAMISFLAIISYLFSRCYQVSYCLFCD